MSRIVWHSVPPWTPSGYGSQSALVLRSLRDAGYDVVCSADSGLHDGPVAWEGIAVWPSPQGSPGSLATWLDGPLDVGRDGLVITLGDASRLAFEPLRGRPVASWIPVMTDPPDATTLAHLRHTGSRPIAMTAFGQAALAKAGLPEPPLVPHGIDTSVFRPCVPGDRARSRAEARARTSLPRDAFVVGVVATNVQPLANRKCLPEVLMAVDVLARRHPGEVVVHLHTDLTGGWQGGQDLRHLVAATIGDRVEVSVPDPIDLRRGLTPEAMASVYNAFDVLCAPSAAEGFCLPLVEAQACGVPVVASDHGPMQEVVGVGRLVGGQPRWHAPDRSLWFEPSVPAIADALDEVFARRDARAEEAVSFAARFDHATTFRERWIPLLDGLGISPVR